jgi:hypothetical protein
VVIRKPKFGRVGGILQSDCSGVENQLLGRNRADVRESPPHPEEPRDGDKKKFADEERREGQPREAVTQ